MEKIETKKIGKKIDPKFKKMATESFQRNGAAYAIFSSEAMQLETQIAALKKILPKDFDLDLGQEKTEDEMFEVLLRAIQYIRYLHTALEQKA